MENLNDVEFGSDKGKEEAPILVAQRYLNIFRQIHIFNKEKRTQFDDELLTLPQNILDFFAKMPGGRLLIEHIEEVKTERGIAFVKSRKEDFINQDTSSDLQQSYGSGGNVVIDASFADTLAKSMAAAFAQSGASQGGNAEHIEPSLLANLNKTFQLIAEEIKSSRASLLEIMQENRKIIASVVASQQATGLLLERLSKASPLPLSQNPLHTEETAQHQDTYNNEPRPLVNRNNNNTPFQRETVSESINTPDGLRKKKKKKPNQPNGGLVGSVPNSLSTYTDSTRNLSAQNDISVKSGKIAPAFSGVIRNVTSKHEDDFRNVKLDEPPLDDISFSEHADTIKQTITTPQSSVSHNVNHSSPSANNPRIVSPLPQRTPQQVTETLDSEIRSKPDFALPELDKKSYVHEVESVDGGLNSLMSDGLDFTLPEQNNAPQVQEAEPVDNGLDGLLSDGLDFALPEQNNAPQVQEAEPVDNELDGLLSDGLDFSLPKQNNAPQVQEIEPVDNGLDSLMSDGLDFALPEQNNASQVQEVEPADDGLSRLIGDIEEVSQVSAQNNEVHNERSSLDDFSEYPQNTPVSSQPEAKSRYAAELDKIREALTSDDIDISSIDDPIALDDYNDDENVSETSLDDYTEFSNDVSKEQPVSAHDNSGAGVTDETASLDEQASDGEDWEWEYVDENGNPIEATDGDDEDWEWEYVEDDGSSDTPDNNTK